MDVTILIFGLIFCVAGVVCMIVGPQRTVTTVVNKVEHSYETSTDYGRLYDLLMEGRRVIILNKGEHRYPTLASVGDVMATSTSTTKRFYGFGLDYPLDGCTKEKFILFCQFHDVKYLDQIDRYLVMQDYLKKSK